MTRTPQQAANEAAGANRDAPFFQRVDTLLDHPQDADIPVTLSTLELQDDGSRVSTTDSSHLQDLPKTKSVDAAAIASATAAAIAAFTAGASPGSAAAGRTTAGGGSSSGSITANSKSSAVKDGFLNLTAAAGTVNRAGISSASPKKPSKLTVSIDGGDSEPLTRAVSVVLASPLLQYHVEPRSPSLKTSDPPASPTGGMLTVSTPVTTSRHAPRSIFK